MKCSSLDPNLLTEKALSSQFSGLPTTQDGDIWRLDRARLQPSFVKSAERRIEPIPAIVKISGSSITLKVRFPLWPAEYISHFNKRRHRPNNRHPPIILLSSSPPVKSRALQVSLTRQPKETNQNLARGSESQIPHLQAVRMVTKPSCLPLQAAYAGFLAPIWRAIFDRLLTAILPENTVLW